MKLTTSDIRIILDALKFRLAQFEKEQTALDDDQ